VPDKNITIYPGSFDPPTNGHLDLIERGAKMFRQLIVAILRNDGKTALFTVEERMEMLREAVKHLPNVRVESFDGLLVRFAAQKGARVILRGIRAVSDYEFELQMALMNRKLQPGLETVFMLPGEAYSYVSSRLVKEVFRLGGDVSDLVPRNVEERLKAKGRIWAA
jgi:pantetheine-phosphate adenylyltransferase